MADLGGGPPPPLILDQTKTRRAEKISFWRNGPLLSKSLDDQLPPPPLSQGLDPVLEREYVACMH